MLLDIRKIFHTYQQPVSGCLELHFKEDDFPDYTLKEPAFAEWNYKIDGVHLVLEIKITVSVEYACARCTDIATKVFDLHNVFYIKQTDCEDCDAELPFDENGRILLEELFYQEIISKVPLVLLCSDECMGLCPICGRRNPCACTQETNGDVVDERLAILKTLL